MSQTFRPSEWAVVLPRKRGGSIFASPYLEPASIVAQETGSELEECLGCGQLREHVTAVLVGDGLADVCSDCQQEHGV
jgi:hypothetical protein